MKNLQKRKVGIDVLYFIKEYLMSEEKDLIEAKTFGKLFGMEFDSDGSLSTASKIGNTPIFKRLNRKQRRNQGIYSHKFQKVLQRV